MTLYFVTARATSKWNDLDNLARDGVEVDQLHGRLTTGIDTWIIQSFLLLKDLLSDGGIDVRFSRRFVPGGLCIAHRDDLTPKAGFAQSYVVGIRADRPPLFAAQQVIVQTRILARGASVHYLPFWPQPGLVERAGERGTQLRRLAYFGRSNYLPPEFLEAGFREALGRRGVEFSVKDHGWNDYSDVDAVLAVRKEPPWILRTKPANKLVNAWRAGVPALLGDEPAYRDERHSALDYLEVTSPSAALAAVDRLQKDPVLYSQMVENGRTRAPEFSREAIAKRWTDFITKKVVPSYEAWAERTGAGTRAFRFADTIARLAGQRVVALWLGPRK